MEPILFDIDRFYESFNFRYVFFRVCYQQGICISYLCCAFSDNYEEGQLCFAVSDTPSSAPVSSLDSISVLNEVLVTTSPSVFIRNFIAKKNREKSFGAEIPYVVSLLLFFLGCFTFLLFFTKHLKESHRFIIDYIHRKDGQKA